MERAAAIPAEPAPTTMHSGRTASTGDAVANAVGVFLGIWLAEAVLVRLARRRAS